MLLRILLALAIIYLIVWLIRRIRTQLAARNRSPASSRTGPRVSSVRCAYCGLFVPEAEALHEKSQHFCCSEHLAAMHEKDRAP